MVGLGVGLGLGWGHNPYSVNTLIIKDLRQGSGGCMQGTQLESQRSSESMQFTYVESQRTPSSSSLSPSRRPLIMMTGEGRARCYDDEDIALSSL